MEKRDPLKELSYISESVSGNDVKEVLKENAPEMDNSKDLTDKENSNFTSPVTVVGQDIGSKKTKENKCRRSVLLSFDPLLARRLQEPEQKSHSLREKSQLIINSSSESLDEESKESGQAFDLSDVSDNETYVDASTSIAHDSTSLEYASGKYSHNVTASLISFDTPKKVQDKSVVADSTFTDEDVSVFYSLSIDDVLEVPEKSKLEVEKVVIPENNLLSHVEEISSKTVSSSDSVEVIESFSDVIVTLNTTEEQQLVETPSDGVVSEVLNQVIEKVSENIVVKEILDEPNVNQKESEADATPELLLDTAAVSDEPRVNKEFKCRTSEVFVDHKSAISNEATKSINEADQSIDVKAEPIIEKPIESLDENEIIVDCTSVSVQIIESEATVEEKEEPQNSLDVTVSISDVSEAITPKIEEVAPSTAKLCEQDKLVLSVEAESEITIVDSENVSIRTTEEITFTPTKIEEIPPVAPSTAELCEPEVTVDEQDNFVLSVEAESKTRDIVDSENLATEEITVKPPVTEEIVSAPPVLSHLKTEFVEKEVDSLEVDIDRDADLPVNVAEEPSDIKETSLVVSIPSELSEPEVKFVEKPEESFVVSVEAESASAYIVYDSDDLSVNVAEETVIVEDTAPLILSAPVNLSEIDEHKIEGRYVLSVEEESEKTATVIIHDTESNVSVNIAEYSIVNPSEYLDKTLTATSVKDSEESSVKSSGSEKSTGDFVVIELDQVPEKYVTAVIDKQTKKAVGDLILEEDTQKTGETKTESLDINRIDQEDLVKRESHNNYDFNAIKEDNSSSDSDREKTPSLSSSASFSNAELQTKMSDLNEKLTEHQQEISDLKLQLNASQQAKASLELEIRQKEEVIIKTQAEALKNEQAFKQELTQLKEKLKEKSKLIEKGSSKELETALKESKAREAQIASELSARNKDDFKIQKVLEAYEKTISSGVADHEKLKKEHETATRHLANLELAFSDVHQKYERTKSIIEGFKTNEETLIQNLQLIEDTCRQHEERYESLKAHAKAQIEKSNKEILMMGDKYESEISKLRAIIKRLEIKCSSLEVSLIQKTEECAALSALCDEVTGKTRALST